MILTLGDVISQATTLAGGRRDWASSEVSFWANFAAAQVYEQVYHTPLEATAISSTSSGENRVAVPSDFIAPLNLSNLSTVESIPQRDAAWIDSQVTQSGAPQYYALYGTHLQFWPTPDSGYSLQLRYYARQPEMLQSSQTPVFNERWHPGWLYKTAEQLELSRNNPEGAAVWANRYTSYMNSIPNDRARRQMGSNGMSLRYARGPL